MKKCRLVRHDHRAGSQYAFDCPKCGEEVLAWDRNVAGNLGRKCPHCKNFIPIEAMPEPLGIKS